MSDRDDVERILERFRHWLESARVEAEEAGAIAVEPDAAGAGDPGAAGGDFGIKKLVEEFTALRHEVKLQTKSGRGLLEQTEATVAALEQAIEQFRSVGPKEEQAAWSAGKSLAEGLADLDEALDRGYREIERARRLIAEEAVQAVESALEAGYRRRPWVWRRLLRGYHAETIDTLRSSGRTQHQLFESFLEGYTLIQKRLRRVMGTERVERIPCEGKVVDPERMTVVEVADAPGMAGGTVLKELRRGYTWRGRVIRDAEVQAVRTAIAPSPGNGRPEPVFQDDRVETEAEARTGPQAVLLDSQ